MAAEAEEPSLSAPMFYPVHIDGGPPAFTITTSRDRRALLVLERERMRRALLGKRHLRWRRQPLEILSED